MLSFRQIRILPQCSFHDDYLDLSLWRSRFRYTYTAHIDNVYMSVSRVNVCVCMCVRLMVVKNVIHIRSWQLALCVPYVPASRVCTLGRAEREIAGSTAKHTGLVFSPTRSSNWSRVRGVQRVTAGVSHSIRVILDISRFALRR